ncbi:MAG: NADH-quinone oxidoreductase subunit J, partial [Dehalococcoidia bacterium]
PPDLPGKGRRVDQVISQVGLYLLLVLGGVGVCLALPRKGVSPQPIGGVIAAAAAGLVILLLGIKAQGHLPNLWFYVFSAIALGASLRVITHPRPVYAALYFILTILSTAGLFVILAAEFVAFALVIIYAGAILITYLFVIMLATQAPSEEQTEVLADYDAVSREPIAAAAIGFILLAALTTMLFRGVPALVPHDAGATEPITARLPGRFTEDRVASAFRKAGLMTAEERITRTHKAVPEGEPIIDVAGGVVWVEGPDGLSRSVTSDQWPPELRETNIEGIAFTFLAGLPGAIELAGVILLMAMLGAVVLARKQVQLGDEAKARHAAMLSEETA